MKIRLDNVVKTFDTFRAVHGVSLEIESGELIALLGPSGSGKTTILRMIAGLEYADSGQIHFGDIDATDIPVRDRGVGFVFQHYALFPHMTVTENIAFGMKVSKVGRAQAEISARVADLLRLVRLDGLGDRFPAQISGGQRQRVALARALAVDPKVLLLDEPFGALDTKVRRDLRRWLREIHGELGITTVFVTHDQEEALELADRVVVMSQGRIEQIGTADDIYDTPNSAFVHDFIGESSALRVTVGAGQLFIAGRPIGLTAPDIGDGDATLYFRPHDVELLEQGGVAGAIEASRRVAGMRRVEVEIGGGQRVEVELPAGRAAALGAQISFRPTRWKIFAATDSSST